MMVLLELFVSFLKIGFTSFGGLSMIPLITSEMTAHGWMTASEVQYSVVPSIPRWAMAMTYFAPSAFAASTVVWTVLYRAEPSLSSEKL